MSAIKDLNQYDMELIQDIHSLLVAKILDADTERKQRRTSDSASRLVGALSGWDAADAVFHSLHGGLQGSLDTSTGERTRVHGNA